MIPKGKFPWYSPGKFIREEVRSVFNQIAKTRNFPHIPTVIMELNSRLQDEESDVPEIAALVRKDPFLAVDVLRIASNIKNLKTIDKIKIKSIEHSIVYVGRKTLSELIVAASITSFKLKTKAFRIDNLMESSLKCAGIAEALSMKFNPALRTDEVYLAGYLCNLGKIVSAICFPGETDQIYTAASDKKDPRSWFEIERNFSGIDHCVLGEIGASLWGLPSYVGDIARNHHNKIEPKDLQKVKPGISEIVGFANLLTPWFYPDIGYCDEESIMRVAENFGLNEDSLEGLVVDLNDIKGRHP